MKALLLLALAGMALAAPMDNDWGWQEFKREYQKTYSAQEEPHRYSIYRETLRFIDETNSKNLTFQVGVNQFADLTDAEFKQYYLGFSYESKPEKSSGSTFLPANFAVLPEEVDWRTKGYVTPIKNQGMCGSCWSFSATGSLEGQHFKKTGKLVSLSEQNLVDCSTKEGNHGCKGGLMDFAFNYVQKNGGIDTEASYPYTARDGTCKFKESSVGATCSGHVDVTPKRSEEALQKAVAEIGPISVAIDASSRYFRTYKSGVLIDRACSSVRLDHGVLAIGYGTLDGQAYWLVKNSWGTSWGDEGFIKMARNHDNMCGIADDASYPLV